MNCYVQGDNVTSMAISNNTADNKISLIVGSEDCQLRIFNNEEIIAEITENDVIKFCCAIDNNKIAVALNNNTVAIYSTINQTKLWSEKSKYSIKALNVFDIDNDGELELIIGYENGDKRNCSLCCLLISIFVNRWRTFYERSSI
jgi:Bardet-Biedl syndrome 2 protein